jgi:hypothetical protein
LRNHVPACSTSPSKRPNRLIRGNRFNGAAGKTLSCWRRHNVHLTSALRVTPRPGHRSWTIGSGSPRTRFAATGIGTKDNTIYGNAYPRSRQEGRACGAQKPPIGRHPDQVLQIVRGRIRPGRMYQRARFHHQLTIDTESENGDKQKCGNISFPMKYSVHAFHRARGACQPFGSES